MKNLNDKICKFLTKKAPKGAFWGAKDETVLTCMHETCLRVLLQRISFFLQKHFALCSQVAQTRAGFGCGLFGTFEL